MNLDRWLNSARILRAPEDGTGASSATGSATSTSDASASTSAPAAPSGSPAAPVPSAEGAASTTESTAAPAANDAPAAKESTPSLLGSAEAKLPGKEATSDQGSDAAKKPAETATPATDAAKTDAAKTDAKDPAKDAAAAKDGADGKKDAAAPADEALATKPQARTYEPFKAPDGVTLDNKQVESFTSLLENAELSHQDRAQQLVDMHVGEIERVIKEQKDHQLQAWSDFTDSLKSDFKKDSELGGNRQETTLGQAKYAIEQLGGTPEQVSDLVAMMNHTGMGNHVGLIRLLNNVYEKYLAAPQPVPGSAPSRASRGNFQDVMYGGSGNGSGG